MKNFLKLIRWKNILVIILTMITMRQLVISPIFDNYGIKVMFPDWIFYLMMLATVLIAAGGYIINDYFDIRIDRINRSRKMIIGVSVTRRKAIAMHLWLNILGVTCGIVVAIAAHKFWYSFIFLGAFILLWLYSRYLKKTILWGNLLIAMLTATVPMLVAMTEYIAVATSISDWDIYHIRAIKMSMQVIIFFSAFAFIYTLMREITKDCEDIIGDQENGVQSLPVALGLRKTNYIICAIAVLSAAAVAFFWHSYLAQTKFFAYELMPAIYIHSLVVFPTIIVGIVSLFGTSKRKYSFLSGFIKVIMLLGIAFSIVFCHIIINYGTV